MNKISNEEILRVLNNKNQQYKNEYSEDRIFGTFVIGLANYGYAENADEIKTITIYLPSFDELCTARPQATSELIDIRFFYQPDNIIKYNYLEILFSDYKIINPRYKEIFEEYFEQHKDLIAYYSIQDRIAAVMTRVETAYEEGDMFETYRLYLAATAYLKKENIYNCYHLNVDTVTDALLWSAKNNTWKIPPEMVDSMLISLAKLYKPSDKSYDAAKTLREGIVKIVSISLENSVSQESFLLLLTEKEKKAWESLKSMFTDGTVVISISKIIEQTGISRPVWNSLLVKLENNKIATVKNNGVKGTTITLLRR